MAEETTKPNTPEASAPETAPTTPDATPVATPADAKNARDSRGGGDRRNPRRNQRRPRRSGRREERSRPEYEQKIISIRRVTRVMAGGRRFSFSVTMVIGDKHGKVGVGIGKAADTQLAIEKAMRDAKKHLIVVPMNKEQQIQHDVAAKYATSVVMIKRSPGKGLVAGSSVRTVLELAGVKDVTGKVFSRSKNKLNNARAAVTALKKLKVRAKAKTEKTS